jgi:hypothetical protein
MHGRETQIGKKILQNEQASNIKPEESDAIERQQGNTAYKSDH